MSLIKLSFSCILCNNSCVRLKLVYSLLIIDNIKGMPHLKKRESKIPFKAV
jgi:hypothetical protein